MVPAFPHAILDVFYHICGTITLFMNDFDLIMKLRAGDERAILLFYKKYSVIVRKYLVLKLPISEVDDVLQDVFLSVLDSINLFRGRSSIKTWILSIARHEVADFYRKRYVRKAVEMTSKLFEGIVEEMKTPEFVYQKKEVKERIEKSMQSLNRRYREVLFWRFEVGMSVKEVAKRMNLSFKATESLLYRARKAFVLAYENERDRLS